MGENLGRRGDQTVTSSHRQEIFFWLGVLAIFFLSLYLLSSILLPFVAGGVIAYFLDPAVVWLTRRGGPRWAATLFVLLVFAFGVVLLIALILPLFRLQADQLFRRLPGLIDAAKSLLDKSMEFASQRLPPQDFETLRNTVTGSVGDVLSWAFRQVQTLFTSGLALANLLSLVFITPVVAFFLLRDWNRIVVKIDLWLPRDHRATIREQAHLVDVMLGGYIRGQLLVCLVLGIYYAVTLTLVGLEFGLVLGILTGVLAFIPYLGFATGFILATGLAVLQFDSFIPVLFVLAIFAFGQVLESSILSPKLVGERVRLHPVWVIFALLAFGSLFGFLGVLIALPAAAIAGVLVRFALSRYMASALYDARAQDEATTPDIPKPRAASRGRR